MPSILVESGFISNKGDREYLNSEKGVDEMATAMSTAIYEYKKSFEATAAAR
jgi:N-acetylmuramoyl-L-alanine amidase